MAADPNLIKGAAMMYQNQMVGAASESFKKGFEQSIQPYIDKIEEDEKKAKLSEEQLGRMLNTLNSNVDGNGFTAAEQTIARNWAMSKRNEYADLAKQLSKMDYSDPNYSNVKAKLDGIKQSFENLRKNRDLLANGKKEFIEQQDNISAANRFFNPYNKEFAKIGDDGMIIYNSKDGDKRLSDTQFPELINREGLDTFRAMSDKLFKFASTGAPTKNALNTVKDQMRGYLDKGNIVDSIIFDKLMPGLYDSEDTKATIEAYKRATGDQKKALKAKLIEDIIDTNTGQALGMGKDVYRAQLAKQTRSSSRTGDLTQKDLLRQTEARRKEYNTLKTTLANKIDNLDITQDPSGTSLFVPVMQNGKWTGDTNEILVRKTANIKQGTDEADVSTIRFEIKDNDGWRKVTREELKNYQAKVDPNIDAPSSDVVTKVTSKAYNEAVAELEEEVSNWKPLEKYKRKKYKYGDGGGRYDYEYEYPSKDYEKYIKKANGDVEKAKELYLKEKKNLLNPNAGSLNGL